MADLLTIDVSHHNGKIDWKRVASQADKAFIKATEGTTFVDPALFINAFMATARKIKVGYYHYATLSNHSVVKDARAEANWFMQNIGKCPKGELPFVLDLEDPDTVLSKQETLLYVKSFFKTLAAKGYTDYMLYSGTSYLNSHLPGDHELGHVPLWIADYNEPHFVPRGWEAIQLLQYTSSGVVEGISTKVDLNRYLKTEIPND